MTSNVTQLLQRPLEQSGRQVFPSDAEAIDADQGRYLGFIRTVAKRTEFQSMNLYDPATGIHAGVDR